MEKIVIDLTSLNDNFTGIERFTANIAYQMIKQSDCQYVLLFKNEIFPMFIEFKDYKNVHMKVIKGKGKLLFSQLKLPYWLYHYRADFYLFMAFPAPFLFFSKRSISAIHDVGCYDCPETMKKLSEIYFKILYRKACSNNKKIITVSEFSKSRICTLFKKKSSNVWVIYNGLSEVFLNHQDSEQQKKSVFNKYHLPDNYLLCLSTLEPRKNLRLLIEAFSDLLLEKKIDTNLVLAGRKGWKIDSLLDDLAVEVKKRIYFTGFIEDPDLPSIYKNADCFVFPSIYEGFGIPPLEALSMGTDVISSDAASLPEILGIAAVYFENGSKESLKGCIVKYYREGFSVKKEEKENVISLYNWENEAEKLILHLKGTCGQK